MDITWSSLDFFTLAIICYFGFFVLFYIRIKVKEHPQLRKFIDFLIMVPLVGFFASMSFIIVDEVITAYSGDKTTQQEVVVEEKEKENHPCRRQWDNLRITAHENSLELFNMGEKELHVRVWSDDYELSGNIQPEQGLTLLYYPQENSDMVYITKGLYQKRFDFPQCPRAPFEALPAR